MSNQAMNTLILLTEPGKAPVLEGELYAALLKLKAQFGLALIIKPADK